MGAAAGESERKLSFARGIRVCACALLPLSMCLKIDTFLPLMSLDSSPAIYAARGAVVAPCATAPPRRMADDGHGLLEAVRGLRLAHTHTRSMRSHRQVSSLLSSMTTVCAVCSD